MDPKAVAKLIKQGFPGATVKVTTDGAGHYESIVICPLFEGKRSLQRHQLVYGTLGALVGVEIHALNLKTFTPEEWQARAT